MAESIFPERRTRSQISLPDYILQNAGGSPLKEAKTALKTQTATNGAPSATHATEETDDELLLSPGKRKGEERKTSGSKRSASPEPHDEYGGASGSSPSEGRELKRIKRDVVPKNGEGLQDNLYASQPLQQFVTSGHARIRSEPNVPTIRRSGRKRSATTSKKPISTASASPAQSTYSPVVSPTKGRAQSVPLFPSTHDVLRIDFRNPPPSPKRTRSPSRSPAKDKFRINSGAFTKSSTLPTIHDEPAASMDRSEEMSSAPGHELTLGQAPTPETPTAEPPTVETIVDPPTPSTSTKTSTLPIIPATPMTQSLNKLIPMSPLTPVPETPFPGRTAPASQLESRYEVNAGWGESLFKEAEPVEPVEPTPANGTMANASRLPRPSLAPPPPPSSKLPQSSAAISKKPMPPPPIVLMKKPVASTSKTPVSKNAFEVLMAKSGTVKARLEEKAKLLKNRAAAHANASGSKVTPATQQHLPIFAPAKGKEKAAEPLDRPKIKMKEKMRKREKPETQKAPLLVPVADDEDDEDEPAIPPAVQDKEKNTPEASTSNTVLRPEVPLESAEPQPLLPPGEPAVLVETPHELLPVDDDATMADAESGQEELTPRTLAQSTTTESLQTAMSVDIVPDSQPTSPEPLAAPPAEKAEAQEDKTKAIAEEIAPPAKAGPSKLPFGKKRQPTSAAPVSRVTRSVSKQKDSGTETSRPPPAAARKKPAAAPAAKLKRTASGSIKKSAPPAVEESNTMDADPTKEQDVLPPGSPMRTSSPAKSPSKSPATKKDDLSQTVNFGVGKLSLAKTPTKSKNFMKPASTPSPSKIARATSLFIKPTLTSMSKSFSMDATVPATASGSGSSLTTLSDALEKLRMPAPSRPNTSMGFNRDGPSDDDDITKPASKDDGNLNRTSGGLSRPEGGLKRSATLGSAAFKNSTASSSKAGPSGKNLVQKPLSSFMLAKGGAAAVRGAGRLASGSKPSIFGVGGPPRKLASKKTTLPMVVGSPAKGGGDGDTTMQEIQDEVEEANGIVTDSAAGNDSDVFMDPANLSSSGLLLEDVDGKGKEKPSSKSSNASRRVSMVSHALSRSLSSLPVPTAPPNNSKGLMGPPATPPNARAAGHSTGSTLPVTSSSGESPSETGSSAAIGAGMRSRSSARIATKSAQAPKELTEGPLSAGKKGKEVATAVPAPEALKILNDCVIFVDVKTDDGNEAGSLFVEMLEGIGAKVLQRVGQTCTHIVYKNGLMSTLTRYRLLRDPKPLVVGIGWVVECVEQRKHVEETNFMVDLDGVNVAGINKRRRSILPRLFADMPDLPSDMDKEDADDGDVSMDGSTSSITMENDLAPLERARRRKSMLVGLRP